MPFLKVRKREEDREQERVVSFQARAERPPTLAGPAFMDRADIVSQKKQNGQHIEESSPSLPRRPQHQISADPQHQRNVEKSQMEIKGMLERHCQAGDRGKDDRGVGKDHGENKAQKDRVEDGVIVATGHEEISQEKPQRSSNPEPDVAREQTSSHKRGSPICRIVRQAMS